MLIRLLWTCLQKQEETVRIQFNFHISGLEFSVVWPYDSRVQPTHTHADDDDHQSVELLKKVEGTFLFLRIGIYFTTQKQKENSRCK